MGEVMLKVANYYHNEGLCVIPIKPKHKAPAIDWEQYQYQRSTQAELKHWFGNGHQYNIGIVHGEVSDNYVAIDIDHDKGIFEAMKTVFPNLFNGRLEQSGSGEGFHIPLRLKDLPNFGQDTKQERPRGNRTWKTELGDVNIRAQFCQTVAPPSMHPSGRRYRFLQKGQLGQVSTLDNLIEWLDKLTPPPMPEQLERKKRAIRPPQGNTLLDEVIKAWPSVIDVFREFNKVGDTKRERTGDLRLLGNGGLLVTEDEQRWYCFADQLGGGIISAWSYCRFGFYDKQHHFQKVLVEMAQQAGIDLARFHGQVKVEQPSPTKPEPRYWSNQYTQMWERVR